MTAVEQFFKDLCDLGFIEYPDDSLIQDRYNLALEMEKEQNINQITDFQLFMYDNDFISDHLWDFERMAIKFLNSKKQDL